MSTRLRLTNEAPPAGVTVRVVTMGEDDDTELEVRDLKPGETVSIFLDGRYRLSVYELPQRAGNERAARS